MNKKINVVTFFVVLITAVAVTFSVTFLSTAKMFGDRLAVYGEYSEEISKMVSVLDLLNDKYVGDYDVDSLSDYMIYGTVYGLQDKWSHYLTAEEYKEYSMAANNQNVGIGIIAVRDTATGYAVVGKVYENSGAYEAGLERYDIIVSVDGEDALKIGYDNLGDVIGGEEGTYVKIGVKKTDGSVVELNVERSLYTINPVSFGIINDNIGYIDIDNFDLGVSQEFSSAVDYLLEQGAKCFIFDVRHNPGGILTEMTSMLDKLMGECLLIITEDKSGDKREIRSDGEAINIPMVVLVDAESYSAAEYFAALLQEYELATVVGGNTTGKGYSQQTFALNDGSAIVLSTRKYYTPKGVNLSETGGIKPDTEINLTDEQRNRFYLLDVTEDTQLIVAMNAARKLVE